jgi:hypothetical protein
LKCRWAPARLVERSAPQHRRHVGMRGDARGGIEDISEAGQDVGCGHRRMLAQPTPAESFRRGVARPVRIKHGFNPPGTTLAPRTRGSHAMLRKFLLPALATRPCWPVARPTTPIAAAAATTTTVARRSSTARSGRTGTPASGGYFGYGIGYGAYGPYGLFGYGYPYGYYGSPYWGPWHPRPPRPGHGHGNGDADADGDDRPPPWRDFGRMAPREGVRRADDAPRTRDRAPAPVREQRAFETSAADAVDARRRRRRVADRARRPRRAPQRRESG